MPKTTVDLIEFHFMLAALYLKFKILYLDCKVKRNRQLDWFWWVYTLHHKRWLCLRWSPLVHTYIWHEISLNSKINYLQWMPKIWGLLVFLDGIFLWTTSHWITATFPLFSPFHANNDAFHSVMVGKTVWISFQAGIQIPKSRNHLCDCPELFEIFNFFSTKRIRTALNLINVEIRCRSHIE